MNGWNPSALPVPSRKPVQRSSHYREKTQRILECAGITVDGEHPWDLRVHDERFFKRLWAQGSRGLGDAYMDGWWDCPQVDAFFHRALRSELENQVRTWRGRVASIGARIHNLQKPSRAFQIGRRHYDLGNDLYGAMLDPLMVYSCGYWEGTGTLEGAQRAKLDLIARKLGLAPGMRVLDIGCGWGGAARYLAEHHDVEVVGVTVSTEQAAWARDWGKGFPVSIRLQDYRELNERFDRIYSIGMFEHVGPKNHATFAGVARRCLGDDGLLLLHTIGSLRTGIRTDPWIERHIFPNSALPSARQICAGFEPFFVIEDWHNFGAHYDLTLMAWHENFERSWPRLKERFDERFHRMWRYYLLSCAGSFRARKNQLWQIVLSPKGVPGGYSRVS